MKTLEDVYYSQLKDLYDAEKRLIEALPHLVDRATAAELKTAFSSHLNETKIQFLRLETIFRLHGMKPERGTCRAMRGLIEENEKELKIWSCPALRDVAMIAAAQKVEHYEMSGYGSAKSFAETLGFSEDAKILDESLREEKSADGKLNSIALATVNPEALRAIPETSHLQSAATVMGY